MPYKAHDYVMGNMIQEIKVAFKRIKKMNATHGKKQTLDWMTDVNGMWIHLGLFYF